MKGQEDHHNYGPGYRTLLEWLQYLTLVLLVLLYLILATTPWDRWNWETVTGRGERLLIFLLWNKVVTMKRDGWSSYYLLTMVPLGAKATRRAWFGPNWGETWGLLLWILLKASLSFSHISNTELVWSFILVWGFEHRSPHSETYQQHHTDPEEIVLWGENRWDRLKESKKWWYHTMQTQKEFAPFQPLNGKGPGSDKIDLPAWMVIAKYTFFICRPHSSSLVYTCRDNSFHKP